jgi:hypothetical protein
MKAENMWFGAVCGLLVFAALFWAEPRRTVSAQARPASPAASAAGRFQLVELHPNAVNTWSAILDTETGCAWSFGTQNAADAGKLTGTAKRYNDMLGEYHFFPDSFDAGSWPLLSTGEQESLRKKDGGFDEASMLELAREKGLCDDVRVRALQAAGR